MLKLTLCLLMVGLVSCRETGSKSQAVATDDGVVAASAAAPDPSAAPSPKWIWGPRDAKDGEDRYFRVVFDPKLPDKSAIGDPAWASLWGACDDDMSVLLNGKLVVRQSGHAGAVVADVRRLLIPGQNVLTVRAHNDTGPAAIAIKLEMHRKDGTAFTLATDESWMTSSKEPKGWMTPGFVGKTFGNARVIGPYGMEPWGKLAVPEQAKATPAKDLALLPGFKAELIYSVPKASQGSWVSMASDPKGRLYVSDQDGSLYRVTVGTRGKPTKVEQVELDIGHAQGLLWAFDSLYVVVNSAKAPYESGLYRLRDTNGDDKLDAITTLKKFTNRTKDGPGWGEHGPHAVVLGPDKKLYVVAGNFTQIPEPVAPTSPMQHYAEDLLLERMPDGRGHDPTIWAPGSCVSRTDENGKTWETFAGGMRNAYDMAFNPEGELFTFDSDMEWDMGMPWYRPTRICHIVSGAEFGWRNGSAKWPTYYPDSVPPVVNVGPGSPTGMTFGTGAKFPAKYQRALFANDWAYGKVYAVHLTPNGASYQADFEPFIVGKPFDVTDIVINTDGAMYITIGGRGTQSGLYRITYTGKESTAPAAPIDDPKAAEARAIRHKLESFHGHQDASAVGVAWPYLNSDDRFLRYAARVAIEAQPVAEWTDRALSEKQTTASVNALVALSRLGDQSLQPRILDVLNQIDLSTLSESQLLETLRAYEVCMIRMGRSASTTAPTTALSTAPASAAKIAARLDALYPNKSSDVSHELCQLLVYLKSPGVVTKSLTLLDQATTQEEQLFYVFTLRNIDNGWTLPQRKTYFAALNYADQHYNGGASFKLFLLHIRSDAIKTLNEGEKAQLAAMLKVPMELAPDVSSSVNMSAYKFVREWTMQDLLPKLDGVRSGRSFESGKAAFAAVSCIKCHRFVSGGGASGPDITGVGMRFQPADLLEAILLPSKVISDQYQATEIITKKKQVFVGTIQEENDKEVIVRSSPLSPETETVAKTDIAIRRPSKVSPMPQGLLDILTEDQVLDLLAYVRSAGDPTDPAFRH